MTTFVRLLSVIIGAAGVVGGLVLIVQAQPAETYGEVNVFLVGYGAAVLMPPHMWRYGEKCGWRIAENARTAGLDLAAR